MNNVCFQTRVAILLGSAFLASSALAKTRPPKPAKSGALPKLAHLRVWKVSENTAAEALTLVATGVGQPAPAATMAVKAGRYDFSSYLDVPAGAVRMQVFAASDRTRPLYKMAIALVAGSWSTLLLRQNSAGELSGEMVDETCWSPGDLTIYNLLDSGSGDLQVNVGDLISARLSSNQGGLRVRGLGRQNYVVATTANGADGKALHWTNEVDFRQFHKASLLVCLDAYGRVRPRLLPNGETPVPASGE